MKTSFNKHEQFKSSFVKKEIVRADEVLDRWFFPCGFGVNSM